MRGRFEVICHGHLLTRMEPLPDEVLSDRDIGDPLAFLAVLSREAAGRPVGYRWLPLDCDSRQSHDMSVANLALVAISNPSGASSVLGDLFRVRWPRGVSSQAFARMAGAALGITPGGFVPARLRTRFRDSAYRKIGVCSMVFLKLTPSASCVLCPRKRYGASFIYGRPLLQQ